MEVVTVLSPTRIAEQIVDTPVPQGRGKRRVQDFLPVQGSTATLSSAERISEQILEQLVDIPLDEDFTGVFRTFPHGKKCGVPGRR